MPNWCHNHIILKHTDAEMIAKAKEGFEGNGFLSAFMPVPQELVDTIAGRVGDPVEQAKLKQQEDANIAKYGFKNWYDWSVANWGTKWDITTDGAPVTISADGLTLTAFVLSAWGPPIEAYRTIQEKFGFEIESHYYEPGMCFFGTYNNGNDKYVNYSSFDEIPDEFIDMFGIENYDEEEEDA